MDPYAGEIRIFAGSYAPEGWQFCAGQVLSIQEYPVLYALLGTIYGGDGTTTFALPDLRGRLPISFGAGTGLSTYALGAKGGYETVTIDTNELPTHTHPFAANTATADSGKPAGTVPAVASSTFYVPSNATPIKVESMAAAAVGSAGGDATGATDSHDNNMPSLSLNFIIAMQGLYPQAA